MNDNCVSYQTLKLQIPESPLRPHFVKARVKVHVYPTAPTPASTDPAASADMTGTERSEMRKTPLKSARRRNPVDGMDKPPACPPRSQENKNRRSGHVIRYQNRTT
jgi:hypothetical protein